MGKTLVVEGKYGGGKVCTQLRDGGSFCDSVHYETLCGWWDGCPGLSIDNH